jgi:hypothetical protein
VREAVGRGGDPRTLERFFDKVEPTTLAIFLVLRMILSEKSATPAFAGASFFGIMR